MLSIFSCASWSSVCLPWRNVYLGLLPIFGLGCLFFWYWATWAVCKFWRLIPCRSHPSETIPKNCRGRNTPKLILWSHHHPDTKTRQRYYKKNYRPISFIHLILFIASHSVRYCIIIFLKSALLDFKLPAVQKCVFCFLEFHNSLQLLRANFQ